jgi:Transposase domain (DUF772)
VPAQVVATVMVLQALEGLSDREAASALRRDIAWKVACGLRLDDEGFHPTVLVYWRNRIRRSARPRRIFEAVRQVVEQTRVLKGRGRRVLDSAILEDAVATQDTVTQLVAAIRRVRRLVPAARTVQLAAHDSDRPGKPDCAGSGQTRAALRAAGHTQTIKPIPLQSAVPGGSPCTTSASTPKPAPSGARRAPPRRSPAPARSASPVAARAARCAGAAPLPRVAAPSACIPTRTSCAPPAAVR